MTAKPMTPEEIADVEVLALLAPTPRNIRMIDVNILDRLIATARLAPVWRKGTEPPDSDRSVCVSLSYDEDVYTLYHTVSGWKWEDETPCSWPVLWWCELPTPPREDEHGA